MLSVSLTKVVPPLRVTSLPRSVFIVGEPRKPATNRFTGRLTLIEPLGPQKIVWFTVGDVLLSAIADDQWQGTVGHAIAFGFDLPRASMFDAKSEARL